MRSLSSARRPEVSRTCAWRPARLAAIALGLTLAACTASSAPDEDVGSEEGEIVSDEAKTIFGELAFLDDAVAVDEAAPASRASAIRALDAASPSADRIAAWAGAPAREDRVVEVKLAAGRTAMLATRTFAGPPKEAGQPSALASITRVVGPDGRALVYAERIRVVPRVTAELFMVKDGALEPVLRKLGNQSVDPHAIVAQALPALDLGQGLRPQGQMSRSTRASFCSACTMTLMAARFLGPTLLGFAGTGGATATCAKIGLAAASATAVTGPGSAAVGGGGWLACNAVFYAAGALISSANLIEGDDARKDACSKAFDTVWLGRVCDGIEPEACSLGAIASAPTPKDKCVKMGQCARAFNCAHDAVALCPSLQTTGTTPEVCERIIRRTCQKPLGLFEDADFAASCETIAAPTP